MKPKLLPRLDDRITVGKRLYKQDASFECSLPIESGCKGTYLKLKLLVDKFAHNQNKKAESINKTFFGEAVLFFTHRYGGT